MFGGAKSWAERTVKPKPCKECGADFTPTAGASLYCPECKVIAIRRKHAKAQREWRAKNPVKHGIAKTNWDLKKYGIDLATYEQMLIAQNGACAICGNTEPGGRGVHRKFAVDHCHGSGVVRGLLCHLCNTAIGLFSDDVSKLQAAIAYLQRKKAAA